MTVRFQQVKALFEAAAQRPASERAAFLVAVTGGDEQLRREVQELLDSDDRGAGPLERVGPESTVLLDGLSEQAAGPPETLDDAMLPMPRGIGSYRIVAALGAGGMGEVYRARDSRLNRDVALKILPGDFAANPDRLTRFRREAQMLAALNHFNIAAIYGLEESGGQPALVLELVEGRTLAERIADGPVAVDQALAFARQIAEALRAAHDKGIVHRDLKPANIKITPAGVVKVLDFGLAKAVENDLPGADLSQLPTTSLDSTRTGVILGTVAYMSPEQARGLPVDRRTDIWAFGCVLFEMLTASKPFRGDTFGATVESILSTQPDLKALPATVQSGVTRILARCLEKDQHRRLDNIDEICSVIDRALARRDRRRLLVRTTVAVGMSAVVAAGIAMYLTARGGSRPSNRSDWVQLTDMDSVTQPALSPDGRMIAFVRGVNAFVSDGQVYAKLLPQGESVALTQDSLPKMGPSFSPDGTRIAYSVVEGGSWDTWIVPALRGEPRRWLRNASGLTWTAPDRLMFSEMKTGSHMAIVASDESRAMTRDVYVPGGVLGMAHRSYLSPDGKSAVVVEMNERSAWTQCRLVPVGTGSPGGLLGPPDARCTAAGWSPDGRWIYFTADAGDGFHVWRQRFPLGTFEQLTSGPTEEEGIAVAPDGKSLITSVGLLRRSVWVRDGTGERQVALEGYAYYPLLSADGRRIAFRVSPTAATGQTPTELWSADLGGGRTQRLFPGQKVTTYDIAPDDRVVAAIVEPDGKSRLWLTSLDGIESPARVTGVEGDNPRFNPEMDIVFRANDGDSTALFRVGRDGSGLRRLARLYGTVIGKVSPDGRWISNDSPGMAVLLPLTGESAVPLLPDTARVRWNGDRSRINISVQYGQASAFGEGRTYSIPLSDGAVLPRIPEGGFKSEAEVAALPGVEVIPYGDVAPGPTSGTYAFSRTATTRNLYRIPLR